VRLVTAGGFAPLSSALSKGFSFFSGYCGSFPSVCCWRGCIFCPPGPFTSWGQKSKANGRALLAQAPKWSWIDPGLGLAWARYLQGVGGAGSSLFFSSPFPFPISLSRPFLLGRIWKPLEPDLVFLTGRQAARLGTSAFSPFSTSTKAEEFYLSGIFCWCCFFSGEKLAGAKLPILHLLVLKAVNLLLFPLRGSTCVSSSIFYLGNAYGAEQKAEFLNGFFFPKFKGDVFSFPLLFFSS